VNSSADASEALRFALLGPVRAWRGQHAVDVGTPQQQAVLAMLLVREGRPVDLDELVDGVWGDDPPKAAVGTVRTYASRLRAGLDAATERGAVSVLPVLRTVGRGYALQVPEGTLDVAVFEQEVHAARTARATGELERAADLLRSALARCEGRPLSGVPGPHAGAVRDRLVERRLQVLHDRIAVDLGLGRQEQLVGELTELCGEYPLREEFRAQLMLALYRSARPAEALAVYADVARLLATEFGADPGPELATLHQRILRLDESLTTPPPVIVPAARSEQVAPGVRPAQLPADTADFTGRADVVAELTAVLDVPAGEASPAVVSPVAVASLVVSSVAGIGGIGKTSLAVHVAHRAQHRFPDGQLYATLRGVRAEPADPAFVLAGFLRALGVTETAIPDGLDERAALYRSVLAGRRVLVVLDDARDVAQVRPLLPGAAGCAVIVTSRSRLATLPATRRVDLEVLAETEAVTMLARIVGADRVAAEAGPAAALARACGLLPLAVRIVGARLAARPGWSIASMSERLADHRDRLAELRADDLDVASCFRLGYDQLDAAAARAFRLLAVPDVPDICLPAAAAALDRSEEDTTELLEHLVDLAMLESTGADRYRYHDLLRLFARQQAERVDSAADLAGVLGRLLDFQLATARNVYRVVRPGHGISALLAGTRSAGLAVDTRDDALDWAAREHAAALVVIEQAMRVSGPDHLVTIAADLLLALDPLLEFGFLWQELVAPARAVLDRAEALGDPRAQGRVGYMLSGALMQLGRLAEAEQLALRAVRATELAADTAVRAEAHTVRGLIMALRKELPAAIAEFHTAVGLAQGCDSRWGQANALLNLATVRLRAGHVAEALAACQESVGLFQPLGDPFGEGYGLCTQGRVMRRRGDLDEAIAVFLRSITVARAHRLPVFEVLGALEIAGCHLSAGRHADALAWAELARATAVRTSWERSEAEALALIGRALAALGEPERSQACLREAHGLFTRLGMPVAEELRPLLTGAW
jgi:DNA-binding SARP family transcriptional activator/tetratricopeptide (TPR) repeat protein